MVHRTGSGAPLALSAADFRRLYSRLQAARAGGPERGALDTITPQQVLTAAAEVRSGRAVSLAAPVQTAPAPDARDPARHRLTAPVDSEPPGDGLHFARDRFAMNVHSDVNSHLDALCHVIWDGTLYGNLPADSFTPTGAGALSLDLAPDGIVGRGVLLDIPRLNGVPWLEPGTQVTTEELAAAEAAQGVRVGHGDLLFVRVGHRRRRIDLGAWDVNRARAGLHPTTMEFAAARQVAALGCDSNSDPAPSTVDGVAYPVHVLAVHALGLHLLDFLQFEELAPQCAQQGRWSFLCVVAPLRLPGATGCPVNPIAIL
ncbi:cyclase family protein [Streptomyces sp. NPDC097727]|uniref:cyclase family protein n=1 Tax=Streptomyces sp. NPDC097727 TaxID=3366092 RepID=UPI0038146A09